MVDETGTLRTLSFVEKYGSLRYHFERTVEYPTIAVPMKILERDPVLWERDFCCMLIFLSID